MNAMMVLMLMMITRLLCYDVKNNIDVVENNIDVVYAIMRYCYTHNDNILS